TSLMILLMQGGVNWAWTSGPVLALAAVSAIGLGLFLLQEKRAAEPMIPPAIWKHRLIVLCNAGSLTTGGIMIGVTTFLPTFVQGVMEQSPTTAGFVLAAMSIGWPLASTISGRYLTRIGFRPTAIGGAFALILGSILFVMLKPEHGPLWAGLASFIIGVGLGLSSNVYVVAVQSSVDWKTRGVATASNMFMRILGTTVGAAVLGSVLNGKLHQYLQSVRKPGQAALDIDLANQLLEPAQRAQLPAEAVNTMQHGLTFALHSVYIGVLVLAAATFFLMVFFPKRQEFTREPAAQPAKPR
ncbi:MAG TPA: MFS transporter, partial [Bacilli bacterium]